MALPKGTPEEVLRSAAGSKPGEPTPVDHGGSAVQLFPTTKHLHVLNHRGAKEPHHRVFELPDHETLCVVAIEEKVNESIENHLVLKAECWEVDAVGDSTGLHASVGIHTVPHHMLTEAGGEVSLDDIVEHMTAIMVERLAKRKRALSAVDSRPIKRALRESRLRKPPTPRGLDDPHAI